VFPCLGNSLPAAVIFRLWAFPFLCQDTLVCYPGLEGPFADFISVPCAICFGSLRWTQAAPCMPAFCVTFYLLPCTHPSAGQPFCLPALLRCFSAVNADCCLRVDVHYGVVRRAIRTAWSSHTFPTPAGGPHYLPVTCLPTPACTVYCLANRRRCGGGTMPPRCTCLPATCLLLTK